MEATGEQLQFIRVKVDAVPISQIFESRHQAPKLAPEALAVGALMLGLFGELKCPACGDLPFKGCIVYPDDEYLYAYAVCARCYEAMSDEGAITERTRRAVGPLFSTGIDPKGRVTARMRAALDAFVAASPGHGVRGYAPEPPPKEVPPR
jgi:hypothetical protein